MIIQLILAVPLVAMIIIWSITNPKKGNVFGHLFQSRTFIRWPLTIIEVFLVVQLLIPSLFFTSLLANTSLIVAGVLLVYGGAVFAIWAKFTMKASWGVPAQHDKKSQNALITSGPFEYSRNPIYVGLLAAFFGIQLALSSWIIICTPIFIWYVNEIVKREEELLLNSFGNEYRQYKKNVRRYL